MNHSERLALFERVRTRYSTFLTSVLWKLTGDKELFAEAMQYALLGIWQHVEKLDGKNPGAYVYRIALTANSRAWRNRIGQNGQFSRNQIGIEPEPGERIGRAELTLKLRKAISRLPEKQGKAIVMRYLQQHDYKMIAEKLCCSQASARSHVSKALATLKDRLAVLA